MTATTAPTRRATMHAAQPDRDWRTFGACRDEDADLFYPAGTSAQHQPQIARAKDVCHACPVMQQCLTWALQTGEPYGIFGGKDEDERRRLLGRRKRRVAAPKRYSEPVWSQIVRDRRPEYQALVAQGLSEAEIAREMDTTVQTVRLARNAIESETTAESVGVAA